jgi:hypothetical protein
MLSLLQVELPVQVDLPVPVWVEVRVWVELPVLEDAKALMLSLLRVELPVQVDLPVPVARVPQVTGARRPQLRDVLPQVAVRMLLALLALAPSKEIAPSGILDPRRGQTARQQGGRIPQHQGQTHKNVRVEWVQSHATQLDEVEWEGCRLHQLAANQAGSQELVRLALQMVDSAQEPEHRGVPPTRPTPVSHSSTWQLHPRDESADRGPSSSRSHWLVIPVIP